MMMKLSEIQAYCLELKDAHAERDALLDEMQRMYTMEWEGKEQMRQWFASMKIVISPEPRNAIKAALRLMTATDPIISIPLDHNSQPQAAADRLERMGEIMLRASDRIRGNPCHLETVLSGLLYDEMHILVSSTATLAEYAKGKANKARAERVSRMTPYLFSVQDPHGCYSDRDELGLRAWARCATMKRGAVADIYGAKGEKALASMPEGRTRLDEVDVWTYYDLEYYACWIDGGSVPIHLEEHGLPVIPVAVHKVEGSRLFSDIADQSEPFLKTLYQSGLWQQQNTLLSAMYTSASIGLWPLMEYEGPAGTTPYIDTTTPLGFIQHDPGTKLQPWRKELVDPQMVALWQQAQALSEQSTIYKTVAGQPLGSGATFSETALLNQAGRLPLVGVQRKAGWALGDALRIAYMLMRSGDGEYTAAYRDKTATIKALDIPETLEVECSVEMNLPQDKLQASNIAKTLRGLVPDEWIIENILGERQPDEMMRQVMVEQAVQALWATTLQGKVAQAQQMQQMQAQAQMQPPAPPMQQPPLMPQGMPQGMPMGGPPQNTNPMTGGLPPEMAMMGGQGPMQPNGTPDEGTYGL